MTRSVTDGAIVFTALTGTQIDIGEASPKIGVCRTPVWDQADVDMQSLLEDTATRLADAGADVADVTLPPLFDDLVDAQKTVMAFESAQALADVKRRCEDQLSPELIALLNDGANTGYENYRNALALAETGRIELRSLGHDALLAPSCKR